jgi:chorismate mutase / prephenate dehydratase
MARRGSTGSGARPKPAAPAPAQALAQPSRNGSRRPLGGRQVIAADREITPKELASIRTRVDRIDRRLVGLLNDRAALIEQIGRVKRATGVPIYAPHREAEVLERVLKANRGPLSARTIEAIYRELMSGSFALEQPLRIGYLGPPGSYSHLAAVRHFGNSVEFEDLRQISGVFTEVQREHVDYGLAPIENSTGGGIVETLDAFRDSAGAVSIYAEVQLAVHHALLANCPPASVRRIHSKPEVFDQCRIWLATQYPSAELVPAASSSRATVTAAEECALAVKIGAQPGSAAIGSVLAGQTHGLAVLFEDIEDNPSNITRFCVISRQHAKRSGDDKTSMMFTTPDKPGALVHVLQVFERAGINLTHIDKRPSGQTNWAYTFFIDAQGHREDETMAAAIKEAETHCRELTVLGSYPRSKRIL